MGPSIFNCLPTKKEINKAIEKAYSFDKRSSMKNPYGDGNSSQKILAILKETTSINLKKKFHNI